jgi:hypothetical protein
MSRKQHTWTDDITKQAIVADRIAGVPTQDVARKYNVHINTVCRLVREFKAKAPQTEWAQSFEGWRDRMADKAVTAVEDALEHRGDVYKAGNLGATVLKGLGHLAPDNVNQVAILLRDMPPEMKREMDEGLWRLEKDEDAK